MKSTIILTVIFLTLSGCNIFSSSDEVVRTYPEAYDIKTVLISELINDVEPPDSANIKAVVIDSFECPDNAECFVPDYITVSERLPSADTLLIHVVKPSQFQIKKQYQISLSITKKEARERPATSLIGYSLIN